MGVCQCYDFLFVCSYLFCSFKLLKWDMVKTLQSYCSSLCFLIFNLGQLDWHISKLYFNDLWVTFTNLDLSYFLLGQAYLNIGWGRRNIMVAK